ISTEKKIASLDQEIEATHLSTFLALVEKRKQGIPIAYLIGYKNFFGYKIKVTSRVLIPRPETETILEHVIEKVRGIFPNKDNLVMADVGTGSGEIALVLSKAFPKAKIIASDISSQAIEVAKENLSSHEAKSVTLLKSDLLKNYPKTKLDVVVANLPYLSKKVYKKVSPEVKHEPRKALVSGDDGLDHYRELLPLLSNVIDKELLLFLEIDPHQFKDLSRSILKHFPNSEINPIWSLDRKTKIGLEAQIKNVLT
ncbi:peptide chain release factor N(5)-glutamine methyltransferase, partial [Patescibacteria group bacterium]|nr:peptide chain release factor N(5)-glutamine methyltransferase [Patescibacteria group bacterium]